jgi:hypothetical protein
MTTKTKPYKLIREKMSPKVIEAAVKKTQELLAALTAGDDRTDQIKCADRRQQMKITKWAERVAMKQGSGANPGPFYFTVFAYPASRRHYALASMSLPQPK